jgi:hypothetical protein
MSGWSTFNPGLPFGIFGNENQEVRKRLDIAERTNLQEKAKLNALTGDAFEDYEAKHFSAVHKANLHDVDWRVPRVLYDKDPKYNRNLIPLFQQAKPGAQTSLTAAVAPGARALPVLGNQGFEQGRRVIIEPGTERQETNMAVGPGSTLASPLSFPHPAGSLVVQPPEPVNFDPEQATQKYADIQRIKQDQSDMLVNQLSQESIAQWSDKLQPIGMSPPPNEFVARPGCNYIHVHPGYQRQDDIWERKLELRTLQEAVRGDVTKPMPRPVLFAGDYDNFHEGKYLKDDCPIA